MYPSNNAPRKKSKQPKNAFFYFMLSFKEEQAKKGINYGDMSQVASAADPAWKSLTPEEKNKFQEIANKQKLLNNGGKEKCTSYGIPISHLEARDREARDAEEQEDSDITNMVNMGVCNNSLLKMKIFLMDVNCYLYAKGTYYVGETALLRFSLMDGIQDTYHTFVDPGGIPKGYNSLVKESTEELGLPPPEEDDTQINYLKVLANTFDYLRGDNPNKKLLPPIFTMPDKKEAVQNFIHTMCDRAGEDVSIFRVYALDLLFFKITNAFRTMSEEGFLGFPNRNVANMQLKKDSFMYTPGLACERHVDSVRMTQCTQSRVKRWAYTVLDKCCPLAHVHALPGRHLPHDLDLDSIQIYQEKKKERIAPTVASLTQAMSSCNTSSVTNDYSFGEPSTSANSTLDNTTKEKEKRVHVPLRMPKTDYSQNFRVAPDLTPEEFPPLAGTQRAGRGRGSGGVPNKKNMPGK